MITKQAFNKPIGWALAVVAGSIIAGALVLNTNGNEERPLTSDRNVPSLPTPSPAGVNWETYTSDYGYAVQYPQGWYAGKHASYSMGDTFTDSLDAFRSKSGGDNTHYDQDEATVITIWKWPEAEFPIEPEPSYDSFELLDVQTVAELQLESWRRDVPVDILQQQKLTLASGEGLFQQSNAITSAGYMLRILVKHRDIVYQFEAFPTRGNAAMTETILRRMAETFRLTDQ